MLTPIDATPDAVFTRPLDINNRGRIVGDYATAPPVSAGSFGDQLADAPTGPGSTDQFGAHLRGVPAWLP